MSCQDLHMQGVRVDVLLTAAHMLQAAGAEKQFQQLLEQAETAPRGEVAAVCDQLQQIVAELRPADALLSQAGAASLCCCMSCC